MADKNFGFQGNIPHGVSIEDNIKKIKLIMINSFLFKIKAFAFMDEPEIEYLSIDSIFLLVKHYLLIIFLISLIIYYFSKNKYFVDKNILFRIKVKLLIVIQLKIVLVYLIYWCLYFIYTIIVYDNTSFMDSINIIIQSNYQFGVFIIFFNLFLEPIKTISFLIISIFIVKLIKIKI